jgi:hypothetical protein
MSSSSADGYLERHHVEIYLRDVVSLVLRARTERPLEFIAEYFSQVLNGTNVLAREFAYVHECPRNRWAFMKEVHEAFGDLDQGQPLTAAELAHLLRLLCPDFPLELCRDACVLCGDEAGAFPLAELTFACMVRFFYSEWLERTAAVFRTCDTRECGLVNRNVLCLTLRQMMTSGQTRWSFSIPPAAVFDQLLEQSAPPSGDIRLSELQRALLDTPIMRAALTPELDGGTSYVAPPRESSHASAAAARLARCLDDMRDRDVVAAASTTSRRRGGGKSAGRRRSS